MAITFSPDEYFNLSFKYGASAEKQWDYLTIKIDGEQVATTKDYSGSNGDLHTGTYTTSTPLSDGEHTLVVDFYNDYSGFNGSDCGYLYDIVASAVYDPAAGKETGLPVIQVQLAKLLPQKRARRLI